MRCLLATRPLWKKHWQKNKEKPLITMEELVSMNPNSHENIERI